ncbi:MAG: phosphohistidine phosphatase SixA [Phycisphaerae bacterium]
MLLYVMRHGVAVERGHVDYPNDAERPLTPRGQKRTRQAARGLRALGVEPDLLLTSPLVRARQTAAVVAAELHLTPERIRETSALAPGASAFEVFRELAGDGPPHAVVLVGHEPDLSELISRLLVGDAHALDAPLKKAAVCVVEVHSPPLAARGTLRALLPPGALRAIGRKRKPKRTV